MQHKHAHLEVTGCKDIFGKQASPHESKESPWEESLLETCDTNSPLAGHSPARLQKAELKTEETSGISYLEFQ